MTMSDIPENNDKEKTEDTTAVQGQQGEESVENTHQETVEDADTTEDHEEEEHSVDYSQYSEKELVDLIKELQQSDDIPKADRIAHEVKTYMDDMVEHQRQEALQRFLSEGGEADDFEYRAGELADSFYVAYRQIREKKSQHFNRLTNERNENLATKQRVLDELRELVDSEETQVSINKLKELQKEWKAVGPVPGAQARNLWANYNALINRFYDNRSIYFELKELDRKKNLESKQELCEKAEALSEESDIREAIKQLDELHEEYKHIGPVPQEDQEPLWQRFKAASDVIHDKRRHHADEFKKELQQNMQAKLDLCQEVEPFAQFQSESIKEWNQKTKELQEIQKKWEAIGSMPREKAKEVNKKFWSGFKQFFNHKGDFFKSLDAKREENLKQKEQLIEKAEEIKESTNWKDTARDLKKLQQEWKNIGPVPEKQREAIYQRFKAACDYFFDRRRGKNKEAEAEYEKNLEAKEAVCIEIESLTKQGSTDTDQLMELSEKFSDIGFVPKSAIKSISQRFEKAVNDFIKSANLDEQEKQEIKVETEMVTLKNSPGADRKIYNKENQLRKKISRLQEDIALWRNNITFFASSKQADKLKAEFEQKIEDATSELEELKQQLNIVQSIR